uniref:hypothetical protein n=1 Tax=Aeromonas caviae TaxID=648 RepID=UPI0025B693D9
ADTLQLLAQQQQLFVTRVPVTLNEAKQAVATIGAQPLTALGNVSIHQDGVDGISSAGMG